MPSRLAHNPTHTATLDLLDDLETIYAIATTTEEAKRPAHKAAADGIDGIRQQIEALSTLPSDTPSECLALDRAVHCVAQDATLLSLTLDKISDTLEVEDYLTVVGSTVDVIMHIADHDISMYRQLAERIRENPDQYEPVNCLLNNESLLSAYWNGAILDTAVSDDSMVKKAIGCEIQELSAALQHLGKGVPGKASAKQIFDPGCVAIEKAGLIDGEPPSLLARYTVDGETLYAFDFGEHLLAQESGLGYPRLAGGTTDTQVIKMMHQLFYEGGRPRRAQAKDEFTSVEEMLGELMAKQGKLTRIPPLGDSDIRTLCQALDTAIIQASRYPGVSPVDLKRLDMARDFHNVAVKEGVQHADIQAYMKDREHTAMREMAAGQEVPEGILTF